MAVPGGSTDQQNPEHTICIALTTKPGYSETFLRAHIERLPARARYVYGTPIPHHMDDDRRLIPVTLWHAERAATRLTHREQQVFSKGALKRFLRKTKAEVVLAEYGPIGAAMTPVCKAARLPLVVHFHGHDAYRDDVLSRYSYNPMFVYASAIVAVSKDMVRQLIALGAPAEKMVYSPYGVDTSFFQPVSVAENPTHFVAVGRFTPKKAPYLTILAFAQVLSQVPAATLTMIGAGELLAVCKTIARSLKIDHAVHFPGALPPAQIAAEFARARAFIQHSVVAADNDREGTPLAVLEAGACGLPVIATRHEGIKDVVVEGSTGFLVDEGDIDQMAKYMIDIALEPQLAAWLGQAARVRIQTEFSAEAANNRLWQVLQATIKQASQHAQ